MVYCSKCGKENDDSASFCQKCGYQLKNEEKIKEKQGLLSLIKIKPIIFGGITAIIFFVIFFVIFALTMGPSFDSGGDMTGLQMISALFVLFIPMVFGGFVAGYHSNSDSLSGILNGVVLAILASLIFLLLGLDIFAVALVIFVASGAAGGFVGVQIKKRLGK